MFLSVVTVNRMQYVSRFERRKKERRRIRKNHESSNLYEIKYLEEQKTLDIILFQRIIIAYTPELPHLE